MHTLTPSPPHPPTDSLTHSFIAFIHSFIHQPSGSAAPPLQCVGNQLDHTAASGNVRVRRQTDDPTDRLPPLTGSLNCPHPSTVCLPACPRSCCCCLPVPLLLLLLLLHALE
eukprot:GHVU01211047.1.p1 GENE.GHVU01211047.1~~GHVU01211047.1.p1  ORF type:complete len:112 (-),score=10.76 GHVU01211047.1:245-580(-)